MSINSNPQDEDVGIFLYNNDLDIYDFLIMKLNPEGLITGTNPLIAPLRYAIVWPNPATDVLNVEYTEQEGELSIIDINGRLLLWQKIGKGRNNINVSHLPAGFFFYQIHLRNKKTETGKFIKL